MWRYLDVQEVPDIEGDGAAVHGRVVIHAAIVGDVGADGERHGLRLETECTTTGQA